MDTRNNIATDLFYKIRSRFSGLKLGTESGEITIIPEDARFFDFDYMEGETAIGHVSISLAEQNSMKVYFSHGITETMDTNQKNNWYGFLKELRIFAKRRLLNFDPRDIAKDNLDQRDYSFLSQNAKSASPAPIGESIMSESNLYGTKNVSYQKLMDTRLIIKHSKTLNDDMAPGSRSRNISALFVENSDGERFKYPFKHLAGARAMQRHVANGGLPYDELGKSITGMSEEIAQLKSFGNYVVRNDLMNSDTNNMVERSTAQLDHLRETLHKLAKQHHYESYKENFKAAAPMEMPQSVVEEYKDKFTVRNFKEDIASVFPVIYRLMQENGIEYSDIVSMTSSDEPVSEEISVIDPMSKFEQWAMNLGEEDAIVSTDPENQKSAIAELQDLVKEPLPAGVDGLNAIESLKGIIDEPALNRAIVKSANEDPEKCVIPLIKSFLQQHAPEVVDQIDWEHGHESEHSDTGETEVEKLEKEDVASECGDSDEEERGHGNVDMNELFEYVKSFYDHMENKFPLGPEKVTIMVGKKFGESAANAVKKLIERMAPEQASVGIHAAPEESSEIARFKQLAGI
jgi:hypothetical protein